MCQTFFRARKKDPVIKKIVVDYVDRLKLNLKPDLKRGNNLLLDACKNYEH